ncbi:hypothetical protein GRS48_02400 [Halorubrum sp. JWXQ-INN 858]|uniref:BGTF surface domain-containing protein n=1 Tax=Halorubrum sp. JWXQ-INN 858 TaxID=2690782 RepID=UPI00135A1F58|nr:BGTF surface domain-containing protein [Halorubrum sp. JWXQ-INN 858]MWV63679.1 hypothetical protein [Halorubrum sp. JWXQ-INN 858]
MSRIPPSADRVTALRSRQRRGPSGRTVLSIALAVGLLLASGLLLATGTPAAAADGLDVADPVVEPDAADAGTTTTHEVTVAAGGVTDAATISVAFPAAFGDGGAGAIAPVDADDVTVASGGDGNDGSGNGGGGDGEGGDGGDGTDGSAGVELVGDPTVDDGTVAVDVAVEGTDAAVDVALSLELTHPPAAGDHDVTATVDDEDGATASATSAAALSTAAAPAYLVDGEPRSTVFHGQVVTVAGLEPDESYTLRRGDADDSDPVLVETADDAGTVRVETAGLDADADYFLGGLDDPAAGDGFELVVHELDASSGDDTVADAGDGATTSLSVSSALRTDAYPVNVSAGGSLDADELFTVLTDGESPDDVDRDARPDDLEAATTTVGPSGFAVALYDPDVDGADDRVVLVDGGENDGTVSFAGLETTAYDLEVRAVDTGATDTATVRVEAADLDGSFGQDTYASPAGDLVEVSVDLGGADEGYVVVGGDRLSDPDAPSGYLDVLHVEGSPTITVNTRLVGTDAPTEDVYASDGTVVSYAHEYGPHTDAAATETFADLRFEDADGDAVADDLAGFRGAAGVGGIAGPLIPQRYRLTVGAGDALVVRDDGVVEPERPFARTHLVLTDPAFREEVRVSTAPSGSASEADSVGELLDGGVDRTNVTEGDRVVLGFEATGIWGALTHFADEEAVYESDGTGVAPLDELLAADEGLSMTVRQTNPGRNEPRTELDLGAASTGEAYLLFEEPEAVGDLGDGPTAGAFSLVLDTRGSAFTEAVSPGDEFAVEFALEGDAGERYRFDRSGSGPPGPFAADSATDDRLAPQFPYLSLDEGGVNATATFRIRPERLEYDRTTADGDLLAAPDNGTVSGTTTLHPATDLEAEIVSDAGPTPTVGSEGVEVTDDGRFSFDADVSASEPGHRVNVELYRDGSLYDSRALLVVSDPDDPFSFAIDDAPERVTVAEGEGLGNLTATVRNEGDIRGVDRLTLDVGDGRLAADERVRAWPDEAETVSFSGTTADLDPGEYAYTLAVDGDETDGVLVVEPSTDATIDPDAEDEDAEADDTDGDDGDVDGADGNGDDAAEDGETDGDESGAGDDDSAGGDDPGDSDDDPAAVPLPFGVGTREALGGTAVVGGTYLLGHWV